MIWVICGRIIQNFQLYFKTMRRQHNEQHRSRGLNTSITSDPFIKHFMNYTHHWNHDGNVCWWPCNNALHYVTSHSAVQSAQSHLLKYSVKYLLRKTPESRLAEQKVAWLLCTLCHNVCLGESTRLEVTFQRFFKGCYSAKWERIISLL